MSKEQRVVVIPEGMELSESDKERIRAELEGDTVETIQGVRAAIAFAKEQYKAKTKEEVAKAKDLPIEVVKQA